MTHPELDGGAFDNAYIDDFVASLEQTHPVEQILTLERNQLLATMLEQTRYCEGAFGADDESRQSFHTLVDEDKQLSILILHAVEGDVPHHRLLITGRFREYKTNDEGAIEDVNVVESIELALSDDGKLADISAAEASSPVDHWDSNSLQSASMLWRQHDTWHLLRGVDAVQPRAADPASFELKDQHELDATLHDIQILLSKLCSGSFYEPGVTGQFY